MMVVERTEALLREIISIRSAQLPHHRSITELLGPDLLAGQVSVDGVGKDFDRHHKLRLARHNGFVARVWRHH